MKNLKVKVDRDTKCKLYFVSGIVTVHARIQSSIRLESFRPNFRGDPGVDKEG